MPYIKNEDRDKFDEVLAQLSDMDLTAGEINYFMTAFLHGILAKKLSYVHINAIIGVLECAKASLVETVVMPYEKKKMGENGNISELDREYYEAL